MLGASWGAIPAGSEMTPALGATFRAADPSTVLGLPGPVRGFLAFLVVLGGGALLVRHFGPFLDRCIDASTAHPLRSVAYGLAAHAVLVFASVYLGSQLAQLPTGEWNAGAIGVWAGIALLSSAAALGFTVLGSSIVGVLEAAPSWAGAAVGALLAGGTALLGSPLGWFLWFVLVSMGIGGPARNWLHASEGPDDSTVGRH